MTFANTIQTRFAFGDDDGSESGHSLDTENANRTAQVADVTILIRIQAEETNSKEDIWTFQLYAAKNGGSYLPVTAARTDGLNLANDTQSRADNQVTTERLTAGSGTFIAGYFDDGTTEDGMGSSITFDAMYTDLEFAIEVNSAYAVDTDYWDLQVYSNGGVALDGYTATPRVTADIPAEDVNVYPAAVAAGADSVDPTAQLGNINVTPSVDTASVVGVDPTAQLGDIDLTPTAVASAASAVDPSVQQDSMNVSPALVSSGADSIDPTTQVGSINITPAVDSSGADSVDPSILLGSINITPTATSAGSSTDLIVIKLDVYHPSTDDLRNNWVTESDGTTNIYQSIDELLASDSDYIKSSAGPSSEIYRTKLESVTDPGQDDYHYINYRYKKENATPQINLIVRLKQSTTVIASWSHTDIGTSEVTQRQKLTTVQAGNITDYTNLYLEFEANEV